MTILKSAVAFAIGCLCAGSAYAQCNNGGAVNGNLVTFCEGALAARAVNTGPGVQTAGKQLIMEIVFDGISRDVGVCYHTTNMSTAEAPVTYYSTYSGSGSVLMTVITTSNGPFAPCLLAHVEGVYRAGQNGTFLDTGSLPDEGSDSYIAVLANTP